MNHLEQREGVTSQNCPVQTARLAASWGCDAGKERQTVSPPPFSSDFLKPEPGDHSE